MTDKLSRNEQIIHKMDIHKRLNTKTGYVLLLLMFFLLAYILPLGSRYLAVPDETRYGEIAREMVSGGDWVAPHYNGVRYFEKPILGYWAHAVSLMVFGENNFAVRFPSVLSVGLSALLIFLLVRRMYRKEAEDEYSPAALAALAFLSCFIVFGVGVTAVLDSLFSFFLTATITAFCMALEEQPGSRTEKGFLGLAGLACGLAFLTKGFLAFALPVLVLLPYLIWERRYRDLLRMSWLPILTAILVALPWSLAIYFQEPDFWRFFFWNEHIRRFMADNAQHKQSFWFFFLTAPGIFLPWIFMAPAAISGIKARLFEPTARGRLIRLCLCWLILPFLFFSFASGKLITYILPCIPPFAVLTAIGLMQALSENSKNKLFQWGAVVITVLFTLLFFAFLYIQFHGFNGFRPYSKAWQVVMVISGLAFFVLCCIWSIRSRKWQRKAIIFGMAPLLPFMVAQIVIPDLTVESKSPGILLEKYKQDISSEYIVISDEDSIGAVCWYFKRADVYMLEGTGELDYGFSYAEARERSINFQTATKIIDKNRGKVVLIARAKRASDLLDRLPKPVTKTQSGPRGYLIWKF